MSPRIATDDLSFVAAATGAGKALREARIQSLWGGYGEIYRVRLDGSPPVPATAIVKHVSPPRDPAEAGTRSHARKVRSYEVERTFYEAYAAACDATCRVARAFGSRHAGDETILVLEDLDASGFALRRRDESPEVFERCLDWLASFHATFIGHEPGGLWPTGTYWHLETRPDELTIVDDRALREAAPVLDRILDEAAFKTFVHGDAKLANFLFHPRGRAVAAVDFQYVGGGPGIRDVAYLLTGSVDEAVEDALLTGYFSTLRAALAHRGSTVDAGALEREWRSLYPIACADFYRFLAGWAPQHYRRDEHGKRLVARVLAGLG